MDVQGWIAVGTLLAAMVLFITKLIPLEMTALCIPVVLASTGVIEPPEAVLRGFGNMAVIALGGIFILGAGLKESGVATLVALALEKMGGRSGLKLVVLIMVGTAVLSGFMSNAATVAVLLPAVAVLSRRTMIPASRLMMPLGNAAILGGTLTLVATTSNLILDQELRARTGTGLGMFDFTKIGLPVAAAGIAYMAFVGRRLLPDRGAVDRLSDAQVPEELALNYGVLRNLFRMLVVPGSKLVGKTIGEVGIGENYDLEVLLVRRPTAMGRRYLDCHPNLRLQADDRLYLEGGGEAAWRFSEEQLVQFGMAGPEQLERVLGFGATLAEVTLAPHSQVFGQTFKDLDFRNKTHLNVIAVWRKGEPIRKGIGDLKLRLGDAFLVSGPVDRVRELRASPDFVVLTKGMEVEDVRRAPIAVLLLVAALIPPLVGWLPLAVSVLGSAILMIATGCVSLTGAQRAIDFRVLFLIIGMLPLGTALEQQGVADAVAGAIFPPGVEIAPPLVFLALFVLTAVVTSVSNNAAAAVILAPVAAVAAQTTGVPLQKAFLAVAFGASCAFVLPFSHQCHLMVMGPGSYKTKDFMKVGLGLSVVMAAATVLFLTIA